MHFLRGTGLAGLRGMLPLMEIAALRLQSDDVSAATTTLPSPQLIRPLLETSRNEIETYCREHHLTARQDFSNEDVTFFRNRLRHELLPLLETYNPNIRQILRRTTKLAAAEAEFLSEQLTLVWPAVVRREATTEIEFNMSAWRNLPVALKRATLRRAVQSLRRSLRDINFEHIESAIILLEKGKIGAKASLPQGMSLTIGYQTFVIASDDNFMTPELPNQPHLRQTQALLLNLPGVTLLPGANWQLRAEFLTIEQVQLDQVRQVDRWEVYLDASIVGSEAILRPRRPGDTFAPLGLHGHRQKINEFMINKKIPANWRKFIPLFVSANRILWVCGYCPDERARLHPATQRILHLEFEQR
jgi:tRNA(Ile)-lysidine synthase